MSEVRGRIKVYPFEHAMYKWRVGLFYDQAKSSDEFISTRWVYRSPDSALAAARRWAKRLGLHVEKVEVTPRHQTPIQGADSNADDSSAG